MINKLKIPDNENWISFRNLRASSHWEMLAPNNYFSYKNQHQILSHRKSIEKFNSVDSHNLHRQSVHNTRAKTSHRTGNLDSWRTSRTKEMHKALKAQSVKIQDMLSGLRKLTDDISLRNVSTLRPSFCIGRHHTWHRNHNGRKIMGKAKNGHCKDRTKIRHFKKKSTWIWR